MNLELLTIVDRVESGRPWDDDVYKLAAFARNVMREIGLDPDDRSAPTFPDVGSCIH